MNELMVFVQTDDDVFGFGSTRSLNQLLDSQFIKPASLNPTFNFKNEDQNTDGINDRLTVDINFLADGSKIRNIVVIQSVMYQL